MKGTPHSTSHSAGDVKKNNPERDTCSLNTFQYRSCSIREWQAATETLQKLSPERRDQAAHSKSNGTNPLPFFTFGTLWIAFEKIKQIASSILTSGLWLLPLQWGSRLLLVARASLWVSCVCPSLWLCDCTAAVVLVGCYSTFFFVWSSKDLEEVWIPKISVHENCILRGTDLSGLFWIGTTL